MTLHQLGGAVDAGGGDARLDEGFEVALAAEGVRLAAIEGEHGLIGRETGEGLVDDRARDAGGLRFARHRREEGVEIAAAFCGVCRRGERERDRERDDEGSQ